MGPLEVLNVTAIVGDKGHTHPYQCLSNNTDGTNILSAVFQPQDNIMVRLICVYCQTSEQRTTW